MEKYFLGSNTHSGFGGFYDEITAGINHVYLLQGGAGTGKSSLMKKVLKMGLDVGYKCESWHCSGDPNSLDGVYVKDLDVVVVDATSPHAVEPKIPVAKDSVINLLDYVDKDKIIKYRDVLEKLSNNKKQCFVCGYEHLNIAYCHYAQTKRIVSMAMDSALIRAKAKEFALDMLMEFECLNDGDNVKEWGYVNGGIDGVISAKRTTKNLSLGGVTKRFFRAITPDGIVGYDDHLKDKTVWHIKGESGSVNCFLRVVVETVENWICTDRARDLELTVFYNPLDIRLVDGFMLGNTVVIPYQESVDGALIYDLSWYEGDFDKYALGRAKMKMKEEIDLAVDYFSKARCVHFAIEKYYISAMNFDAVNILTEKLLDEIFDKH